MRYRASNGVTVPVVLSQEQARADYERALATSGMAVEGVFGKVFEVCVVAVNGAGRPVQVARTVYVPWPDGDRRV